ncbi:MAG: carboxypeptidase-like regulatory domain-containing protein [Bacteroidota bacterium]
MRAPLCLFALVFAASTAFAQVPTTVSGRVTDAETGDPVPAATVQIEGTLRGTIANPDGRYALALHAGTDTAALLVRTLGYVTAREVVQATGGSVTLDVALAPDVQTLGEIVVSGEDPALQLMRRVVAHKARWQERLRTWQADAFSRQVIESDTAIAAITESATQAFWDRERGLREIVQAYRTTENLTDVFSADVFTAADGLVNLYDDDVDFGGYDLVGPTSADALRFYRFAITGERTQGGRRVYDVAFETGGRLQPGFEGTLAVLDLDPRPADLGGAAVLLAAEVSVNDAVRFPLVQAFDLTLAQQYVAATDAGFLDVGADADQAEAVWLPADFRLVGKGRIGMTGLSFPDFGFRLTTRLSDYQLNVPVPDSLFTDDATRVDSVAVASGAALVDEGQTVPLTDREATAYAEIDSTDTLQEAFEPSGVLARFVQFETGGGGGTSGGTRRAITTAFEPVAWANRVEQAHLGASATVSSRWGPYVGGQAAYRTGLGDVGWGVRVGTLHRFNRTGLRVVVGYDDEVVRRYRSDAHARVLNTASVTFGGDDYFDYHDRRRAYGQVSASIPAGPLGRVRPLVRFAAERHRSLVEIEDAALFGRGDRRVNPAIAEGDVHAVQARVSIGSTETGFFAAGTGHTGAAVRVAIADADALGGDFSFVRTEAAAGVSVPTFLRRRLFPNALHLRMTAGTTSGDHLPQRTFAVDGSLFGLAPFGTLRAQSGRPIEATRYVAGFWEHDFRSVPFEVLGWEWAAVNNVGLLVHGAHAAGEQEAFGPTTNWQHHEIGVGLSGGLALPLRLDVTFRLDQPGTAVTLGFARLF